MMITVLNETRRTLVRRDTGASNWRVDYRKGRPQITEEKVDDQAIIWLNSNHTILDCWYYNGTQHDETKQLFLRVKVG